MTECPSFKAKIGKPIVSEHKKMMEETVPLHIRSVLNRQYPQMDNGYSNGLFAPRQPLIGFGE